MPLRDMVLAALTSMVWGFAFIAARLALDSFSAPQLTALRFLIACLPILVVKRPTIAWSSLVLIGLTLFTGQFLLLFFAFAAGMPPGLASVSQQMQVFFTVILAALFLRDVPTTRQTIGMVVAFAGLALIGLTIGGDLRPLALALALAGALSWAIGNVLVKRHAAVPIFPLVVWCSLVPPLPSLLLSALYDQESLVAAMAHASWLSIAAAIYLGTLTTIFGYAVWGRLLQTHSSSVVAPFALLSPCTAILASAAIFGEAFAPLREAGMALILAGLAIVVVPARLLAGARRRGLPVDDNRF
jgi:O-acetylserine/cysteine efflux transporter